MSDFENTFREEIEKAYNHGKLGALFDVDLSLYRAIASMQGEAVGYIVLTENDEMRMNFYPKAIKEGRVNIGDKLFTYPPSATSKIAEQGARIKDLEQQLEEARKDAGRYQWLRENQHTDDDGDGWLYFHFECMSVIGRYLRITVDERNNCLDAAIDSAIRQIGGAE